MTASMRFRPRNLLVRLLALIAIAAIGNSAQAQSDPAEAAKPPQLVGSWLTTYQIPAFGGAVPNLLSFTREGIAIETDTPQVTGTVLLSNGHGAWKETGKGTFAFTYRKLIFNPDVGGQLIGLAKTDGTVTVSPDGTKLQLTVQIQFTDTAGNVTFSTSGPGTAARIVVDQTN